MRVEHIRRSKNSISFILEDGEELNLLKPDALIAYKASENYNDKLKHIPKFKNIFNKRSFVECVISGSAEGIIALPEGCVISILEVHDENVLYESKNILFYSKGISIETVCQPVKHVLFTGSIFRARLRGRGTVALMSSGELVDWSLDENTPMFVRYGNLVSLPAEKISCDICTYGNEMAVQNGGLHFILKGQGKVLIESLSSSEYIELMQVRKDSILKRILRRYLPGGDILIP